MVVMGSDGMVVMVSHVTIVMVSDGMVVMVVMEQSSHSP